MANKTSKKTSKKHFYLTIISSIKTDNKLPNNIKKQNLNYYVKSLKTNGIIVKKGYGTWELTKIGEVYLNQKEVKNFNLHTLVQPHTLGTKESKNKAKTWIRGHGYRWNIKTPVINDKQKILKLLERKKVNPSMTKTKQIKFFLMGHNVKIGERAININFNPDIYYSCKSATNCHKMAMHDLVTLIVRLENLLGYSLKVRGKHQFKPSFKHFGDVNNPIAGHYQKEGKAIRVMDQGKEWLVIDFSDKKFIEMETTDNSRNIVDQDHIITPFMNTLRHDPKILDKLRTENEELKELINTLQVSTKYLLERESRSVNIERFIN